MRRQSQLCLILLLPLVLANCALFGKSSTPAETARPEATTGGTPKVVLTETTYDFGKITEEKDYIHEFVVKNEGTGVLQIKEVVPD
ncbi:MAG: hypothetical protein AB9873_19130 [Syntrophobacteraceae bacterium]